MVPSYITLALGPWKKSTMKFAFLLRLSVIAETHGGLKLTLERNVLILYCINNVRCLHSVEKLYRQHETFGVYAYLAINHPVDYHVFSYTQKKKWSQNSASEGPFWKTASLWQRGGIFLYNHVWEKKRSRTVPQRGPRTRKWTL